DSLRCGRERDPRDAVRARLELAQRRGGRRDRAGVGPALDQRLHRLVVAGYLDQFEVVPGEAAEREDRLGLDDDRTIRLGDREPLALEVLGGLDAAGLRDADREGVEATGQRAQVLRSEFRGAVLVDAFRREEQL